MGSAERFTPECDYMPLMLCDSDYIRMEQIVSSEERIDEQLANDVQMKFIITDSGKPFDPTTKEDIDTTLPAEERLIGGLGIHLVKQIMDSINYERTDGKNVLTLRKKIN